MVQWSSARTNGPPHETAACSEGRGKAIRWRDAGISTGTASLLWSESVAGEVLVFFFIGPPLVRRLGAVPAAMLAATAGVVRWTVMAASTEIFPLALVEPLHGLTFALLHLASMRVISETVPNRFAATAQAIYGTVEWAPEAPHAACVRHGGEPLARVFGTPMPYICRTTWMRRAKRYLTY
jgi:hypothetical protein